jgi:cytochrome c biogenesis protein CcdA/thiol-disulfide isomerase/thioredoxin
MLILILFAFLGGIVTILSPCVLPVLPVVLSGSIGRGKSRPLGIVSGFVASFTVFTLTLTSIVQTTGISADSLRYLAVCILLFFGLVLTIPILHEWYTRAASKIAGRFQGKGSAGITNPKAETWLSGYTGGTIVGFGLGLVWTPCVGPIMASVISLALTENIDAGAIFITAAFSIGTAIPMLGIMMGGKTLLHKVPILLRNTAGIQKTFGIIIIVTAISIGLGWDRKLQAAVLQLVPEYGSGLTAIENVEPVKNSLAMRNKRMGNINDSGNEKTEPQTKSLNDYGAAPEIVTQGRWYNTGPYAKTMMTASSGKGSPPLTMKMLHGKVVLLDFWTYSCVNCVRTIPHLAEWYRKYGKDGFVIIGVHTPEFEFEKNPENVKKAIAELGVTWPVVLDNEYKQWRAYSNQYWPAHYFIDANGHVRYRHFGEGNYEESERIIQALLKEAGTAATVTPSKQEESIESDTPETYLGYGRAWGFISNVPLARDTTVDYHTVREPRNGEWSLTGRWIVRKEYIVPESAGSLQLGFNAKNVFLVIQPETRDGKIEVRLDGVRAQDTPDVHNGILVPEESRLYQLVNLETPGPHILKLNVRGKLRLFAFTFG